MAAPGGRGATRLVAVPLNRRGIADAKDGRSPRWGEGGRRGKVGGVCGAGREDGARGGEGWVVLSVRVGTTSNPAGTHHMRKCETSIDFIRMMYIINHYERNSEGISFVLRIWKHDRRIPANNLLYIIYIILCMYYTLYMYTNTCICSHYLHV